MANDPRPPRRPVGTLERAEAAFKAATTPAASPDAVPAAGHVIPPARESVTLRLDRDVLEFFQEDGPGWQERINAALRAAAGL